MKAIYQGKEGNKVSFDMEIDGKDFENAVQKAYLQNRGRFNIAGFRKGKVPRRIIEMNYGEGIFYEDAINLILPEEYQTAIEELDLEPVDNPDIDIGEINKGENLLISVKVDVKPEMELGDYKAIEVEKIDTSVTDETVENKLKELQDTNSRLVDGSFRPVENGDLLTIDFEGFKDGVAFPGGAGQDYKLEIGSNSFIPGFEDQLIGKEKDQEVEINLTFPEEYHEESLAGQDAVFKVTIHDVKMKELPELDDEFVKDVSEFDTLEELRVDIREKLEESFKEEAKIETENRLVEELVKISKVDIPRGMIESQIDDELRQFDFRMRGQGFDLEQYLELTGMSIDDMRSQFEEVSQKRVSANLALEALAKAEGIEVNDEDLDEELGKLAEQYQAEDKEAFIEDMKKGDLEYLKSSIKNSKAIDFLRENAKFI